MGYPLDNWPPICIITFRPSLVLTRVARQPAVGLSHVKREYRRKEYSLCLNRDGGWREDIPSPSAEIPQKTQDIFYETDAVLPIQGEMI